VSLYAYLPIGVALAALLVLWSYNRAPRCPVCGDGASRFRIVEHGDCDLRCRQGHHWRTDWFGRNAGVRDDGGGG
jgi:hypothetical protein